MVTTCVEAAQCLKDVGGLKLVVFGADGHEVAAMFVRGSVIRRRGSHLYCLLRSLRTATRLGNCWWTTRSVVYGENTDAFVIPTAQ
jgi:hypothetical protein